MHLYCYDCDHYYYYCAAFNAPCAGRKDDELQAHLPPQIAYDCCFVSEKFVTLIAHIADSEMQLVPHCTSYTMQNLLHVCGRCGPTCKDSKRAFSHFLNLFPNAVNFT